MYFSAWISLLTFDGSQLPVFKKSLIETLEWINNVISSGVINSDGWELEENDVKSWMNFLFADAGEQ